MLRIVVLGTIAVLGFSMVLTKTLVHNIDASFQTVDISGYLNNAPDVGLPPVDADKGKDINILVLGSDVRDGANAAIGGATDGMRSDVTMIVHISADRSRVEVVSIPRDTMLELADCTTPSGSVVEGEFGQFNAAFAIGSQGVDAGAGAACTWNTVQLTTGIRLDHFVVVDFSGFAEVVDAVGGVPICVESDIYSAQAGGLTLTAGPHLLTGIEAAQYMRARKGDGLGDGTDPARIERQQQLIKNLASEVLSAKLLFRWDDVTTIVQAVASSLTMDPELGNVDSMVSLAFALRHLEPSTGLVLVTAPWEYYPADRNRVQLTADAQLVWDAIKADQPISVALAGTDFEPIGGATAGDPAAPTGGSEATQTPGQGTADTPVVDPNSAEGILGSCPAA